jgi:Bacterial dipeptidyl-peptidase Sh3 domain
MPGLSAPLFKFGDSGTLARDRFAGLSFTMTGPGVTAEAGHLPVRGDLAHFKLAGRYFVPHYAVPMPHGVNPGGAVLRKAPKADADVVEHLPASAVFNVLDITGGWAWGQVGEDGFVGYLPMETLLAL